MNRNKFLPTGSGSVDYCDKNKCIDNDFIEMICNAANRELMEETNLPACVIEKTFVAGFYRDLNRAGKPEFCCITILNTNSKDVLDMIKPEKSEQSEQIHVYHFYDTKRAQLDLTEFGEFMDVYAEQVSVALYMAYDMACDYVKNNPDKIKNILDGINQCN